MRASPDEMSSGHLCARASPELILDLDATVSCIVPGHDQYGTGAAQMRRSWLTTAGSRSSCAGPAASSGTSTTRADQERSAKYGLCRRNAPRGPWRMSSVAAVGPPTPAPCVRGHEPRGAPRRRATFRRALLARRREGDRPRAGEAQDGEPDRAATRRLACAPLERSVAPDVEEEAGVERQDVAQPFPRRCRYPDPDDRSEQRRDRVDGEPLEGAPAVAALAQGRS